MRVSGHETSCNLTRRIISPDLGTKPGFLLYSCRLTSSYDHLQYVKQMMASYPGPILHKCLSTMALFSTIAAPSVNQYRNTRGSEGQVMRLN